MEKSNRNALKIGFQYAVAFLLARLFFDILHAAWLSESGSDALSGILAQLTGEWSGRLWSTLLFFILTSIIISELGARFYNQHYLRRWWLIGFVHGVWLSLYDGAKATSLLWPYIIIGLGLLILPLFLFPGDSQTFVRPGKSRKNQTERYLINGGSIVFKDSGDVFVESLALRNLLGATVLIILALVAWYFNWPPYETPPSSLFDFKAYDFELLDELLLGVIVFFEALLTFFRFALYNDLRARLPLAIGNAPVTRKKQTPFIAWHDITHIEMVANSVTGWHLGPTAEIRLHLRDGGQHRLAQISLLTALRPLKQAQYITDKLKALHPDAVSTDDSLPNPELQIT